MVPASGTVPDEQRAASMVVQAAGTAWQAALECFEDPVVEQLAPIPIVRAAFALLTATAGEPLNSSAGDRLAAIGVGQPASPGRVIGPTPVGSDQAFEVVVNERYAGENPALVMPSLAHALLWSGPGAGECEEVVLHGVVAALHAQSIARWPALAHLGTELSRRQNSLTITLLNSRSRNDATISLFAPDGCGTIPGGAPGMQTPDFASVPFASGADPERPIPSALRNVLYGLGAGAADSTDEPLSGYFNGDLVKSFRLGERGQLSVADRVRVAVTLGIMTSDDIAKIAATDHCEVAAIVAAFALAPALSCWGE